MKDGEQIEKLRRHYPALWEVDDRLRDAAISSARLITVKEGTRLFADLQPCEAFPFILSGKIRVFKQSINGRELSLYNVTSGDVCVVTAGCLLGQEPYNAAAVAQEDSVLVMMPAKDFEDLLGQQAFRKHIFSLFSKRIVELMQLVYEVAFQKLDRRLAALLLRMGRHIKASHQELADELGTVREMVTRLLNSFSDAGLISLGRGRIEILDQDAIETILQSDI